MQSATYRSDLRYVQTQTQLGTTPPWDYPLMGTRERIVGPYRWWFYRVQFWRFEKFKRLRVLRERRLDAWQRPSRRDKQD